ncbi:MAG: DUF4159 domain-containing protein [Gemmatimonadaceae bacterium]|nr:DUF4159 domain-containing protein [Gemmatimonadaceae bacterium]MDQ3519647.1 DUF4159 domain-containing protein [Gemmatimonadota bacterium]
MMRTSASLALVLALLVTAQAGAQLPFERSSEDSENIPYDGRFTFVRIRFTPMSGSRWGDLKWNHDYPRGERNFTRILSEVGTLKPHLNASNILTLDDPELFKYPIAYLCEPGFWTLTEKEAKGLGDYLKKGGFLIVDDFVGNHWMNFAARMKEALPDARLVQLDASHAIFDSFFHIESLDFNHPNFGVKAEFWGIFEDNDPKKRLMVIVNYNNDIGDYWEWSDTGFIPIQISNEAYKLGVNYVIYGMTR